MQGNSLLVTGVLCLSHLAFPVDAAAQTPTPLAEADDLGLRLPSNVKAIPGQGRRVVVPRDDASEADEPPVAKVYLEVGDWLVVNMPNGGLRSVPRSDTTATDRPFVAATKKSMTQALAAQFVGFKQRGTKHYLFIYNTSEPFYEATSRILETMHPKLVAYCRRHKLSTQSIDTPLVVIMFKTEAEFRKYRQMRGSILAYYNSVSNRIILYEQSALAQVAPTIAVKQSISMIAHEGVHQILHNIGVQQRLASWPMWISEGLPEYFAPTSVARRVKWKGVGLPNDLRMRELIRHLQERRAEVGTGRLVHDTVTAAQLTSTGYAVAWALTHFLASARRKDFFAYLREVSRIQPLVEPADEVSRFTRHFGHDFAKLERQMIQHVRDLPYVDPIANQPHYIVVASTPHRRIAVMTSSPLSVKQARGQMLAQLPLAERANVRFTIQTFPNKSAADQAMQGFSRNR